MPGQLCVSIANHITEVLGFDWFVAILKCYGRLTAVLCINVNMDIIVYSRCG